MSKKMQLYSENEKAFLLIMIQIRNVPSNFSGHTHKLPEQTEDHCE